jgi:hypothetical protein
MMDVPRAVDLDVAMRLARECEQGADTDEAYELASATVPALIAEVRYWRTYVENLRGGQWTGTV